MGDQSFLGAARPRAGAALMPPAPTGPSAAEALRQEAGEWFARMRAPDADDHRAAFEDWIGRPGHRAAYDRISLRWQQAGLLAHTDVAREREGLPQRHAGGRTSLYYALAACLAGAILVGLLAWQWPIVPASNAPSGAQLASSEITSPVGLRRAQLSDGSILTLDTETSVRVHFSGTERRITLVRGRARFEVAHDASRPFIVSAGEGEVVAHGTVFDVSLTTGRLRVSLVRGSVEVRRAQPAAPGKPQTVIRLVPGQSIALVGVAPTPQAAPAAETAWASGMIAFDGAPLSEVLATANRYSARKVSIDDHALGALRVTGTFRADRPEELAAALAAAFGLRAERRADGFVLRRRTPPAR